MRTAVISALYLLSQALFATAGWGLCELAKISPHAGVAGAIIFGAILGGIAGWRMGAKP